MWLISLLEYIEKETLNSSNSSLGMYKGIRKQNYTQVHIEKGLLFLLVSKEA